ncbi:WbqC family protein [Bradyrhizobium sp. BR 10261]|uniref:WbqC family protein n=1 Tax=Bradyrhizobium sp. BR 10261 TaxID=2749992 RepID=UPI001C64B32A|nr:WbqC family protein [Bradyrhizobium sp. BR 10261]MBW7961128.1 WbqC family protein [Bradyrhizobium sp. BR 10261]
MSRTVVIHQPDFLPYLGFFHRFLQADLFVALDHVQFVQHSRNAWSHRDKIKTASGERWMSVSVKKCPMNTPIKDVRLSANSQWQQANLNLLRENYRGAPFFRPIFDRLEQVHRTPFEYMAQFNLALIDVVCEWIGIEIPRVMSSTLVCSGRKSEMIAGIVADVGGDRYLSGTGARQYHEQEPFDRRGIEVIWQDFTHPVYPQQFDGFIPYLSVIDALFNCGPEATGAMLRSA